MANVTDVTPLKSSAPGFYYSSSASDTSGVTDFAYAQAPSATSTDVVLKHKTLDDSGNAVSGTVSAAHYVIPDADPNSGAIFDNQYATFDLGNGSHALIYTQDAKSSYTPSDLTTLKLQEFDASGDLIQGPTTLDLGGKTSVKDLYQLYEASGTEFGSAFVAAYSTYDPITGKDKIAYEKFDDSGNAIGGATLESINDGTHHGLDFGTFYSATNPNGSPDYILMNRNADSQSLRVALYDTDLNQMVSKTIVDKGPDGEASTSLDKYNYLRPGTDNDDNFAVTSQTFEYQDSSGTTHEEIALQKVNPYTLAVEAKTEFEDINGSQTGVGLEHLKNGNIVAAYNDGGQTFLQEYNKNLAAIGLPFALPDDNDGYDNIASVGGNSVELFWRDHTSSSSSSKTIQHSEVFKF